MKQTIIIDGVLDSFYRNDEWAENNNCYFYYHSEEDTTLLTQQKGVFFEPEFTPMVQEDITVEIYSSFDENYAYFYVDVVREDISDTEAIEFYVDTDVMSCDGVFYENAILPDHADTHFTMMAKDLSITDVQEVAKYSLANQKESDMLAYFNNPENVKPFYKYDEQGNKIGYGCEVRFPLVHTIENHEMYKEYAYNIAILDICKSDELVCLTTGYNWWSSYDTLKMVPYLKWLPIIDYGDVDENQTIGSADALAVLKYVVGKIELSQNQQKSADVNVNGSVDASDALIILQYMVGKIVYLPVY